MESFRNYFFLVFFALIKTKRKIPPLWRNLIKCVGVFLFYFFLSILRPSMVSGQTYKGGCLLQGLAIAAAFRDAKMVSCQALHIGLFIH